MFSAYDYIIQELEHNARDESGFFFIFLRFLISFAPVRLPLKRIFDIMWRGFIHRGVVIYQKTGNPERTPSVILMRFGKGLCRAEDCLRYA